MQFLLTAPRQQDHDRNRREQQNARALRRSKKQSALAEQERLARLQAARDEVAAFYEEHVDQIGDELPRALFRMRLNSALHPSMTADQTWHVGAEMVDMINKLVKVRQDNLQTRQTEESRRTAQIAAIQNQINEIERDKALFALSPTADSEVVAHELRAFDHQIAALRDQIAAIRDSNALIPHDQGQNP